MELFLKTAAAAVLALVLIMTVGKQERDIALLLSIGACCMTGLVALEVMQPVLHFLHKMEELGDLLGSGLSTLLKAVGIGLVSELVAALCADAGNGSLGKQVQLLGSVVILSLTLPLLENLLELIQNLLGGL